MMMDPIIRFGKRSLTTSPLIRFGKRQNFEQEKRNANFNPLIRFGKRGQIYENPLENFYYELLNENKRAQGFSPHIRFGKRSSNPEFLTFYPLESAADYLYRRNRRPNSIFDEGDTMLRFGKK